MAGGRAPSPQCVADTQEGGARTDALLRLFEEASFADWHKGVQDVEADFASPTLNNSIFFSNFAPEIEK